MNKTNIPLPDHTSSEEYRACYETMMALEATLDEQYKLRREEQIMRHEAQDENKVLKAYIKVREELHRNYEKALLAAEIQLAEIKGACPACKGEGGYHLEKCVKA